jgi:hypothetical protein
MWQSFINHLPDWFVAIFTGVLVVVTGGLWRSTEKLWVAGERQREVNERSLKLAGEANDRARQQFVDGRRPWISIEAQVGSDKIWEEKGARFYVTAKFKNLGLVPAKAFFCEAISSTLGPANSDPNADLLKHRADVLRRREAQAEIGLVLAPGQVREVNFGLVTFNEDIERNSAQIQGSAFFSPIIFITVAYRFEGSGDTHSAGSAYILLRAGENGHPRMFKREDGNVPRALLGLDIYPASGHAD